MQSQKRHNDLCSFLRQPFNITVIQVCALTTIIYYKKIISSVQFSCSVVSDSLGPGGLQDARLPPWTARRSNQFILKEISPECSLEGLMLKLKRQYFGHLMRRADSFEKTLMLGKIEARGEGDDIG